MYQIMKHFQNEESKHLLHKKITGKVFFDLKEKESQEVQEKLHLPFLVLNRVKILSGAFYVNFTM